MWCDNFDLDLLKVVPEAQEILADVANIPLVTHGHTTDGKLNHPSAWNAYQGLVAFFGFKERGSCPMPFKPAGYYTPEPIVECTFMEAIRDAWPHTLAVIVEGKLIWNAGALYPEFETLLYVTRKWGHHTDEQAASAKSRVIDSLKAANYRFHVVMMDHLRYLEMKPKEA